MNILLFEKSSAQASIGLYGASLSVAKRGMEVYSSQKCYNGDLGRCMRSSHVGEGRVIRRGSEAGLVDKAIWVQCIA